MNGGRKRRGYLFLVPGSVSSPECVIGEQRLGEFSAKFAMPGCHTGGPVRWSVAGTGKTAISHFHSPNRCSPITVSGAMLVPDSVAQRIVVSFLVLLTKPRTLKTISIRASGVNDVGRERRGSAARRF